MMDPDVPPIEHEAPQQARENQFRFVINVMTRRWMLIAAFTVVLALGYGGFGLLRREEVRPAHAAYADVVVKQSAWEKDILRDVGGMPLVPLSPRALVLRTSKENLAEDVLRALTHRIMADGGVWSGITASKPYKPPFPYLRPFSPFF